MIRLETLVYLARRQKLCFSYVTLHESRNSSEDPGGSDSDGRLIHC
jgi:hypothetical protein